MKLLEPCGASPPVRVQSTGSQDWAETATPKSTYAQERQPARWVGGAPPTTATAMCGLDNVPPHPSKYMGIFQRTCLCPQVASARREESSPTCPWHAMPNTISSSLSFKGSGLFLLFLCASTDHSLLLTDVCSPVRLEGQGPCLISLTVQ